VICRLVCQVLKSRKMRNRAHNARIGGDEKYIPNFVREA
jgi:hypothetical protein